jgi:hypothetical protein
VTGELEAVRPLDWQRHPTRISPTFAHRLLGLPEPTAPPKATIFEALAAAALEVDHVGKHVQNADQGYMARGIDHVLDAVHGPLARAGVVMTFEVLDRDVTERMTKSRNVIYHVVLRIAYTFHGPDGSSITVTAYGEALDSTDKATGKAMSAALKVVLIQVLTIPVNGEDADERTHDLAPTDDEPRVPDEWVAELVDRMAAIAERVGRKAYPREWQDARLGMLDNYVARGMTETEYAAGRAALDACEARLDAKAAADTAEANATPNAAGFTDGPDPSPDAVDHPTATPEDPTATEQCPVCANPVTAHEEGCTEAPDVADPEATPEADA